MFSAVGSTWYLLWPLIIRTWYGVCDLPNTMKVCRVAGGEDGIVNDLRTNEL